jgi:hypothetical protein
VSAKICIIVGAVLIGLFVLAMRLRRWRKRRAIIASLDAKREECAELDRANAEKLASLEGALKDLEPKSSAEELAGFRKTLESAREECGRAARLFQATRESIGRLVGGNVPTEALPSCLTDYVRVSEDLEIAGRVLKASEERKAALEKLEQEAAHMHRSTVQAIELIGKHLAAAEISGFKLADLRIAFEIADCLHRHICGLWANHELAATVRCGTVALDALNEIDATLANLPELMEELIQRQIGSRRRIEKVRGSSRQFRPILWYLDSIKSDRLTAARRSFECASSAVDEADKLLISAALDLARTDLFAAAESTVKAEARIAEAEASAADVKAADPRTQEPLASPSQPRTRNAAAC